MAALRRVLLALWGLICVGVSVALGIMLINSSLAETVINFLDKVFLYNMQLVYLEETQIWLGILIGCFLLFFGILCVIVSLMPRKAIKKMRIAVVDGGAVDISLAALQNVVKKASSANAGVKSVETKLLVKNNGLHVILNIEVLDNIAVPEIGNKVREEVRTQLEAMAGIIPAEVKVIVTDVLENKEGVGTSGN